MTPSTSLAMALDPVRMVRRAAEIEPDPWQAALLRSAARQLILLCSRQSGKSTITAALALHEAVFRAPALVLLLAPALRQAQELFRKVKAIYGPLGAIAPLKRETELTLEFASGSRIVTLPGRAETIRGFSSPSLLVVDEAAWVKDDVYQALRPMLAVSQGRIILLSTPYGKRGFFHHEWTEGGDDWERVCVTAHDCPRISAEWLEEERNRVGAWVFEQEYLCVFKDTTDQVFSTDDVMAALDPTVEPLFPLAL